MAPKNNRILDGLCSSPWLGSAVVAARDLREILLATEGRVMAEGRLFNIKSRPLGAGVYRIYLDLEVTQ